ncbi:hypothetical protein DKX38_022979 [Salix brachista]|uniref:Uncharacterized protein n=1 Tax=Salix brachista TaxID=2182728 RepID=A0A5N5K617_9ROSI|nr:hypothetical protein DKX38_022979 [Salix brachista]
MLYLGLSEQYEYKLYDHHHFVSIPTKNKWCTTEVEFSRSILVWHLATEICSGNEEDASNASTSKCLSEYMTYLLVIRPNMLSKGFVDEGFLPTFSDKNYEHIIESYKTAFGYDDVVFQREWKTDKKSVVLGGSVLAKQLLESRLESKKRWEMIEEVWMEMLSDAVAPCPWK